MLSGHWRDTYADPWLQAGPLEMLVCLLGKLLGMSARGVPVALAARSHSGSSATCGTGAIPSELFIALMWLLAAQAARRKRMLLAGCILGLSAGFETWGLLGAPVLFLLPQLRRTIGAGFAGAVRRRGVLRAVRARR